MKIHTISVVAIMLLFTVISSCKKDLVPYQNDARVYFYDVATGQTARITSQSFSFATRPATRTQDTIYVKVKIMGLASGKNRSFSAAPIDSVKGAKPGANYKLLNGTIMANQYTGLLPVVVYRTADLKTVTQKLELKIIDGLDFKAGVTENNFFTLNWNDALIKPGNWDTLAGLATYFGTYSLVKYQFIIDVTGRSDFPAQGTSAYSPNLLTNQQMLDYKLQVKAALAAYNSSHVTPLTDELGSIVTFPN